MLVVTLSSAFFVVKKLNASEFDKFAKKAIREIGGNKNPEAPTKRLYAFLEEQNIESGEIIDFLDENMKSFSRRISLVDPDLSPTSRLLLKEENAKSLISFTSRYPLFPLGESELRVLVYERENGEIELVAHIFFHTL